MAASERKDLGKSLVVRDEVFDHLGDLFYASLCKAKRFKNLFTDKWEEKERELHLLCQTLREASIDDERCSKFQLEQGWGLKSDNAEVMWAVLKSLGAVTARDGGCELVGVAELAQVTFISLIVREETVRRKRAAASKVDSDGATLLAVPTDASALGCEPHDKLHLVAAHFDSLLRLILGVPPTCMSSSLVVTSADIDALGVWLRPKRGSFSLSELSPFFVTHLHASFKDVLDWLKVGVGISSDNTLRVSRAHKDLVVAEMDRDKSCQTCVSITDCVDSTIYCLFPIEFLLVSHCKNCTIVVGAAKFAQTVHSTALRVIVACKTKIVSTCIDCSFFLGTNECPLLVGDNRHVSLGPYNTTYDLLQDHLDVLEISGNVNYWNLPKVVGLPPLTGGGGGAAKDCEGYDYDDSGVYTIMPPENWSAFVVPFTAQDPHREGDHVMGSSGRLLDKGAAEVFLAPKEYLKNLDVLSSRVDQVRTKILDANLGPSQRQELQQVIRAHFKEWLLRDGHFGEIQTLTEMESVQ